MARYFALIPAAGTGSRMGDGLPKQYFELSGRPLLYYSIRRLCAHSQIQRVFVVLAAGDQHFARFDWSAFKTKLEPLYCGGETRRASVLNGLLAVRDRVAATDWMLVHDAARCCLGAAELSRLIVEVGDDAGGGLLAVPVTDTLKRANREREVLHTEPRANLWQAQTPQMFRYRLLIDALRAIDHCTVTDEASAVEEFGVKPKLVVGDPRNLKVTYPEDLALAELILKNIEPQINADIRR